MKKTGLFLNFMLDINPVANIFSKNIIKVEIFRFENNLKVFVKDKQMNITEFYNFYNTLMNSTHIFYEKKLKQRYPNGKKSEENDICPICDENKVSIMLDCYHFFCEKCIKTDKLYCALIQKRYIPIDKIKKQSYNYLVNTAKQSKGCDAKLKGLRFITKPASCTYALEIMQ